jgi:hypothetical protein
MKYLLFFFHFYKTFIAWSIIISILIGLLNPQYIPAVVTKFFLVLFAWYVTNETSAKRKLTFYKNMGISPIYLFISLLFVDSVFTIFIIFLFKTF